MNKQYRERSEVMLCATCNAFWVKQDIEWKHKGHHVFNKVYKVKAEDVSDRMSKILLKNSMKSSRVGWNKVKL